jgi:adenylate cyclase class 1
LPQFYQIVKVDGRAQVIPFRTQTITPVPMNQDANQPLLQQYFS